MEDGWEDPQGRGAHQAQRGKGLGLTAQVPGPWTPLPTCPHGDVVPAAIRAPAGLRGSGKGN